MSKRTNCWLTTSFEETEDFQQRSGGQSSVEQSKRLSAIGVKPLFIVVPNFCFQPKGFTVILRPQFPIANVSVTVNN